MIISSSLRTGNSTRRFWNLTCQLGGLFHSSHIVTQHHSAVGNQNTHWISVCVCIARTTMCQTHLELAFFQKTWEFRHLSRCCPYQWLSQDTITALTATPWGCGFVKMCESMCVCERVNSITCCTEIYKNGQKKKGCQRKQSDSLWLCSHRRDKCFFFLLLCFINDKWWILICVWVTWVSIVMSDE